MPGPRPPPVSPDSLWLHDQLPVLSGFLQYPSMSMLVTLQIGQGSAGTALFFPLQRHWGQQLEADVWWQMLAENWDFGWGHWPEPLHMASPGTCVASSHRGCAPAASVPEDIVEDHGIFVICLWK